MSPRYHYLPWVREGAAHAFTNPDTLAPVLAKADGDRRLLDAPGRPARQRPRAASTCRCASTGRATSSGSTRAPSSAPTRSRARPTSSRTTSPASSSTTPTSRGSSRPRRPASNGRLRPWLVLVVLRQSDERQRCARAATCRCRRSTRPLAELPDLVESWAWAHAQVVQMDADAAGRRAAHLAARPEPLAAALARAGSRPETRTSRCVVPAFDAGRKAGLGEEVTAADEDKLAPAWDGTKPVVTLPVYYHWEFATGSGGDFETLARRLRPQPVAANVGRRPLRVGTQPFGLPDGGVLAARGRARRAGAVHAAGADDRVPQRAAQAREPRRRSRSSRRPSTAAGSRRATPSPPTPASPRGCAT